jgi:hypothetical protein
MEGQFQKYCERKGRGNQHRVEPATLMEHSIRHLVADVLKLKAMRNDF